MKHVMIDIETMGTRERAPIFALAAVEFDPQTGEQGRSFYQVCSLESAIAAGAERDEATERWWASQSAQARTVLENNHRAQPIEMMLAAFAFWYPKGAQPWGNGVSFDLTIIKSAMDRSGIPVPWEFWDERDVRTMVLLGQQVGFDPKRNMPFQGVRHDALDDSRHQARYVSAIWRKLIPTQA